MSLRDTRGVPFSTTSRASLDRYEEALELFHGYFEDPLAVIDEALEANPEFVGHLLRAGLMLSTSDKRCEGELRRSVETTEALSAIANDRERQHARAARAWLAGDFQGSVDGYGRIVVEYPRDGLALQLAHLGDYYLGQAPMLRDRIAQVLPHWDESVPGFGYVLGMHAFGLEETNLFDHAENVGRRALELNPRDPWAVHAVAHVMEMQGRLDEGIDWLNTREADWADNNAFAAHNWWHLALYHLDLGQVDRALEIFDRNIWPDGSAVILDMIDASSMLWRMKLRGIDVGERWNRLADAWGQRVDEGYYSFNDAHAMMALVGAGRDADAERLLRTLEQRVGDSDMNAGMIREVGLPVVRAIHAFGAGRYDVTVRELSRVRSVANWFGGSNAQRDFIGVTLVEAALQAGDGPLARALAAERVDLKPQSPFNRQVAARAQAIAPRDPSDRGRHLAAATRIGGGA